MTPPIYEPKGKAKEYGDSGDVSYSVYVHTFPNGKKYVGISKNIARRFRSGYGYQHQPIMWAAIKKYGWSSVKTEIVMQGIEKEEAKNAEIHLIAQLQTSDRNYGYNETLGGEGGNGRKLSEEEKRVIGKRMSEIHKGVPLSEEHKKKLSDSGKGKPKRYSPEGLQRIIDSNRTRVYSMETREKMSRNTKAAMKEKNMGEYLSKKWQEEKEIRKAKLRITMYDRYGVVPKNHSLRDDAVLLNLDQNLYPELFTEMEKAK